MNAPAAGPEGPQTPESLPEGYVTPAEQAERNKAFLEIHRDEDTLKGRIGQLNETKANLGQTLSEPPEGIVEWQGVSDAQAREMRRELTDSVLNYSFGGPKLEGGTPEQQLAIDIDDALRDLDANEPMEQYRLHQEGRAQTLVAPRQEVARILEALGLDRLEQEDWNQLLKLALIRAAERSALRDRDSQLAKVLQEEWDDEPLALDFQGVKDWPKLKDELRNAIVHALLTLYATKPEDAIRLLQFTEHRTDSTETRAA